MAGKLLTREHASLILAAVMFVSLALTIVAEILALVWNGQPIGNTAATVADTFATFFSIAFFISFGLVMFGHQRQTRQ